MRSACIWAGGDAAAQYLDRNMGDSSGSSSSSSSGNVDTIHDEMQTQQHLNESAASDQPFDWHRFSVQTIYAGVIWAPIGHWWYNTLDSVVSKYAKEGTVRFLGLKMAGECALLHPVSLVIYFTCIGVGGGEKLSEVKEQLRRDFFPTLACE
jgi:hypothetical protein